LEHDNNRMNEDLKEFQ